MGQQIKVQIPILTAVDLPAQHWEEAYQVTIHKAEEGHTQIQFPRRIHMNDTIQSR